MNIGLEEAFSRQLNDRMNFITPEKKELLSGEKKYYNGDPVEIGDRYLFGFLMETSENFKLIALCEKHFNQFEIDDGYDSTQVIPKIKFKND